ncbi:low-density lipoprotein receptor-related protein 6-like [Babylonia areolata]|uniref:low-density lipoprotein receptor-related protein 6-like n=1 Tax=Babylonia areolata TaxID=304850 RepID=UPI003FD1163B
MATTMSTVVFGLLLFVLICHRSEACGWNTTAIQGTVQSPNFPANYSISQDCVYIITAPAGYQITLTFTDFDLQPHGSCVLDFVEIRDGDDETSPFIGRYCNSTLPAPRRTFGNQMWIRFFSDGSVTRSGFKATFTSANLQAPFFLLASNVASSVGGSIHRMDVETRSNIVVPMTGTLYRPIAVDYDPVEQTIYWTEVGLLKGIRGSALNGSGMHTVLNTGSGSTVDGLAVDPLSRLIFYTDTGRDLIAMLTMSTFAHRTIINTDLDQPRAIVLHTADGVMFWTDWGAAPKIERANYDASDRRTLVNTGLYFPNALALDVPNNRLYWVDAGTDRVEWCDMEGGNRNHLLILSSSHHFFGVALHHNFLYITDWYSGLPTATSMIVRLDIDTSNATVYGITSGRRLNDIHLVDPQLYSNNSVNGCGNDNGGCDAICIPLPSNSSKCICPDGETCDVDVCGWNTTDLQGTVQSPNFPANYSNYHNCTYIITAPVGYQVTLTFTDFDLEAYRDCRYDFVEIRDGDDETSPFIGRYCNSTLPAPRRTFGNQMWIRFFSDGSVTRSGFKATFTSANLQAPFFLLASNVASSVGGSIHRMDVETRSNIIVPMNGTLYRPIAVDYDPVEQTIYWTEVGLLKGIRGSALNGSGMHTVLNTGSGSTVDGLAVDPLSRLIFYTDTGRDLIAMLTMSTFAHRTIINTNLDQPRAIVLHTADGVMFWTDWGAAPKIERANYDASDRRTLVNTGLYLPNALALDVPNNRLYWVDAGTDRVEWCDMEGGNRNHLLILSSSHRFFGVALLHNFLYITDWYSGLPTATSMIVRLDIDTSNATVYGITSGRRLNDIHLVDPQLYSNNSVNGCGNDNGGCDAICIPLPSNSSKCMCPDGETLMQNQRTCDVDVCGWNTTDLQGTVQSPNFPANYSNYHNCTYIITAPVGYRVTLTFTDFDLEAHRGCRYDFVEIRDGDDETSPFIGRYCNSTLPAPRRTFGNQMWIRFFSDGSVTRSGFKATFTSANLQAPFFLLASNVASSVGGSIHRMDVETRSNIVVPMTGTLYRPIAVDYDPVEQTIYWTEVGLLKGIRGSALNGSGMHTVLNTGNGSTVDGLAVDPLSRLIFYTDTGRDLIAMLTMSTFAHRTIINTNLDQPRAIVLHTADGVMFWTDWGGAPKIERANYDASDRRTLVNTGLYFPNALALDVPNNRLYWVDAGTDRVEWCDMEGGNRNHLLILSSSHHFFGVALLHNFLYITDWYSVLPTATSMLVRLDIDTSNATVYGITSGRRLNDIHLVDPQLYSNNSVNGCGNDDGGCDVFCIPLPSNSSKCMCPDGQILASDQTNCVDESSVSTPVMSTTPDTSPPTTPVMSTTPDTSPPTTPVMSTTPDTSPPTTPILSTTTDTSVLPTFTVVVSSTDGQPFDTDGDRAMTLSCDPDMTVDVTSYVWNVPCTGQTGNTCVFKPRPAADDGKKVTCTVTSSDGRVSEGELQIELNYPPQEAPTINGHSKGKVYQEGQSLTMTCSVHGGKPLVASVFFSCGVHEDTSPDVFSKTEVHSILSIKPLTVSDDGKTCFCTATWKDTDWYKMSATAVLEVQGSQPTSEALNIPAIAGGSAGAVVVVVIIVAAFLIVKRRGSFYHKRSPRNAEGEPNDDGYSILRTSQQQSPEGPDQGRPYIVNACYEPSPPFSPEVEDSNHNSTYETLDNVAMDVLGAEAGPDYLNPVYLADLKPTPCSWKKTALESGSGYIHPVSESPGHF